MPAGSDEHEVVQCNVCTMAGNPLGSFQASRTLTGYELKLAIASHAGVDSQDCAVALGAHTWSDPLEQPLRDVTASVVVLNLVRIDPKVRLAAQQAELLRDEDWKVRRDACTTLGGLGEFALPHIEELACRLEDDERQARGAVIQAAIDALINLGPPAVDLAAERLRHERAAVRRGAAVALGRLGHAAVPVSDCLAQRLEDSNELVRSAAAEALGRLGNQASAPHLERLASLLDDEFWKVRQYATTALGNLAAEPFASRVKLLAQTDPEPFVRRAACEAYAKIRGADP